MRFGVLTVPVEDRSPAIDTAPQLKDELAHQAYFFRRRAAEALGAKNPDDMKTAPNKFHNESADVRNIPDEGTTALSFERILQLEGRSDGLYLNHRTPGFQGTFKRGLPQTFEEAADTLFTHRVQGGNGTNLLINGLVAGAALGKDARGDLSIDVIAPNHNPVAEFVREQAGQHPGLTKFHELHDIQSRISYHVNHQVLHEKRTDTLMIATPPPPDEAINEAVASKTEVIAQSDFFIATDDYTGLQHDQTGLVPSSNVMKKLRLRPGQILLVNDAELMGILKNGHNGTFDPDISLPDVLGGSRQSLEVTNGILQHLLLHIAPDATSNRKRVASIGKRGGRNLGLFREGAHGYAVEATLPSNDAVEGIVRDADSPHISLDVEEGTGRGDASASSIILDDIPLSSFMVLCKEQGYDIPYNMTPDQERIASMLVSEFAGRMNSTLVHFSHDSNFGHLSPDAYRTLLLKYAVQPALRCAMQAKDNVHYDPQHFECPETGLRAAAWIAY